jgi:hypothetical protein
MTAEQQATIIELAQSLAPRALEILAEIMENSEAPAAARASCANAIIDRAHGRPKQAIDQTTTISFTDIVKRSLSLPPSEPKQLPTPVIEQPDVEVPPTDSVH